MSALAPQAQYPTFKFDKPGAKIRGTVSQPPKDSQVKDFGTQEPKFWPDGNPVMQTRVVLRVSDGTEWAIYAQGRMAKAITAAIVMIGAGDLEVGGELEVTFSQYGEGKNPAMPPKEYSAVYASPVPGSGGDEEEPPF